MYVSVFMILLSREVTELVESRTHDLHSSLNKELQQRATRTELKSGLAELSKAADRQQRQVDELSDSLQHAVQVQIIVVCFTRLAVLAVCVCVWLAPGAWGFIRSPFLLRSPLLTKFIARTTEHLLRAEHQSRQDRHRAGPAEEGGQRCHPGRAGSQGKHRYCNRGAVSLGTYR